MHSDIESSEHVGIPIAHRDVYLNGLRLHFVEAGEGPLILLLHGFPEYWYSWRHQIPALASQGYRVVALDMRGFNLSDKPVSCHSYSLEKLTQDIALLVDNLGGCCRLIVGHDWGGAVAWDAAMRHPDKFERLVVMNAPHPATFLRSLRTWRQVKRSLYMLAFQVPVIPELILRAKDCYILRSIMRRDFVHRNRLSDADLQGYVKAWKRHGALRSGLNYYRALGTFRSWFSMREIRVPTLLIWGERDRYLGPELATLPERWVPFSSVETLPEASHWVQQDEPDRVNELLRRFLGH